MSAQSILQGLLCFLNDAADSSADQKLAALEAAMLVVSADGGVGERIAREVAEAANA